MHSQESDDSEYFQNEGEGESELELSDISFDVEEERTTNIVLRVSCENLTGGDLTSKSDPYCILKAKDYKNDGFVKYDQTEVLNNMVNPAFTHAFEMTLHFQKSQYIRFEIYDQDPGKTDTFMGAFETSLIELFNAPKRFVKVPLEGGKGESSMITVF